MRASCQAGHQGERLWLLAMDVWAFFCFDVYCKVSQSQKEPVLPVVALTENDSNGNVARLLLNLEQVTKLGISGGLQQQQQQR